MNTLVRVFERVAYLLYILLLVKLGDALFEAENSTTMWVAFVGTGLAAMVLSVTTKPRLLIPLLMFGSMAIFFVQFLFRMFESIWLLPVAMGASAGSALAAMRSPVTPKDGTPGRRIGGAAVLQRALVYAVGIVVLVLLLLNVTINYTYVVVGAVAATLAPFVMYRSSRFSSRS